jgi:hypothetical protein
MTEKKTGPLWQGLDGQRVDTAKELDAAGWRVDKIAAHLCCTEKAVFGALTGKPTHKSRSGPKPLKRKAARKKTRRAATPKKAEPSEAKE